MTADDVPARAASSSRSSPLSSCSCYGSATASSGARSSFIAVVFGWRLAFGSFFYSDKIALSPRRRAAWSPRRSEAPELHGIVDRLCALADMPKPRVAIARRRCRTPSPPAATARHSVVCVTTGLLRRLDDRRARGRAGARAVPRGAQGRRGDDDRLVPRHHGRPAGPVRASTPSCSAAAAAAATTTTRRRAPGRADRPGRRRRDVYAISFLLIRLLSRYRELAADRAGALLTGQPSALASALHEGQRAMTRIPTKDLRAAEPLNAFYFAPALQGRARAVSLPTLFSTHPSLERRLRAAGQDLRAAAGQRDRPGGAWASWTRCSAGPSRSSRTWTSCSRCPRPRSRSRRRWTSRPPARLGLLPGRRGHGVRRHREGRPRAARHGPGRRARSR